MHNLVSVLRRNTRITDNMDDRNEFAIVTGHTTVRGKFSRAECRNESGSAFHSSISIGGIRCNKLVWISSPIKTVVGDKIQQCQLIVW